MRISKEEIKKIDSYLSEFGIMLWLERQINAELTEDAKQAARQTKQQPPISKVRQDNPIETKQKEDKPHQAQDLNKDKAEDIARDITRAMPRRIVAVAYEEVVIVYEAATSLRQTNPEEKQLLENMLLRCGVNIKKDSSYTPEIVLAYPPFIENLERRIGEDQWLDVFAGFLMGILRECPQGENCFIIVLGEATAAKLPPKDSLIKFMNKSGRYKVHLLVIEALAAMLAEPNKRKDTWEALIELRKHFSTRDAA